MSIFIPTGIVPRKNVSFTLKPTLMKPVSYTTATYCLYSEEVNHVPFNLKI